MYKRIYIGPGRYNYFIENKVECIVLGSSRSTCYYSTILSDKLGLSVLNVGLDGSALIYSRSILEIFKKNNKTKLVILNIDLFEFQKTAWSGNFFSMIEKFAPLYGRYDYIDTAIEKDSTIEKMKFLISSYKYNDLVLSILYKTLSSHGIYQRTLSPEAVMDLPIDQITMKEKFSTEIDIDNRKKTLLIDLINTCRESNIQVVMVESPLYYPDTVMTSRDRYIGNYIQSISKDTNVPFIRITQETYPEFKNHQLYKDVWHLNHKGSQLFSKLLGEHLSKIVENGGCYTNEY